ncbi:MAG: DUF6768 family protein [Phycisphaerales bacterium]
MNPNSFDDDIRSAMNGPHDDAALGSAGDEGLIRQMSAAFRGRMRFWIALTWFATLLWTGAAVWAGIAFFRAAEVRDWIMYAAIFHFAGLAIAMLKLWNMMELNRSTHSREIKRIELQIARLADRSGPPPGP